MVRRSSPRRLSSLPSTQGQTIWLAFAKTKGHSMTLRSIAGQLLILAAISFLPRQAEAITFEATAGGAYATIQGYTIESVNGAGWVDALGPFYANDPAGAD